ncbi:MAG: septum formation initiator family protein [Alphaproteobacteria bacterium]|nr:septum formation initiator family protein [Alphaproteobacteria bacterium]
MSLTREIRRRLVQVTVPTLGLLVVGYFLYHAFQGDRGILAWVTLRAEVAEAEALRAGRAIERKRLETLVAGLQSGHLDPDLLDERARLLVGLGKPDEVVIYLNRQPPETRR